MENRSQVGKRGPGRPPGTDKVQIAVRIPESVLERVREHAQANGSKVTDLIRLALEEKFPEESGQEPATAVVAA